MKSDYDTLMEQFTVPLDAHDINVHDVWEAKQPWQERLKLLLLALSTGNCVAPSFDKSLYQDSYPFGFKRCRQRWFIEHRREDPVEKDRIVTMTTAKYWNEAYTDVPVAERPDIPNPPSQGWNNPKKGVYYSMAWLHCDYTRRDHSVWVTPCGVNVYAGLDSWLEKYMLYYFQMTLDMQQKFRLLAEYAMQFDKLGTARLKEKALLTWPDFFVGRHDALYHNPADRTGQAESSIADAIIKSALLHAAAEPGQLLTSRV